MDALRDLLSQTLLKHGLRSQAQAALVCHRASVWVTETIPALRESVAFPAFRDGVLEAHCQTSIAAQELRQQSEKLLADLRLAVPGITLRELRIMRAG